MQDDFCGNALATKWDCVGNYDAAIRARMQSNSSCISVRTSNSSSSQRVSGGSGLAIVLMQWPLFCFNYLIHFFLQKKRNKIKRNNNIQEKKKNINENQFSGKEAAWEGEQKPNGTQLAPPKVLSR